MKRRLSILNLFYILLFSGCAILEPAEEFDPNALPSTAAGGTQTVEIPISRSSDDAEERSTGVVSLTNTQLELTTYKGGEQIIGLRFKLDIPEGAVVNDAYIQFTSRNKDTKTTNLTLYGESTSNPATFNNADRSLQAKPLTSASINWTPSSWTSSGQSGQAQMTPSLVPIINELSQQHGWVSGNHIAFYIKGSGIRRAVAFDENSSLAPKLIVTYTTQATTPGYSVESQIIRSSDDAEERGTGFVSLTNTQLELTTYKEATQIIGLRFKLDLPENVAINNAYIQFTSNNADSSSTSLTLYGESSSNPSTFTDASQGLQARPLTNTSVNWSPAPWGASGQSGEAQMTPSLAPIIEELSQQHGWVSGNHIVFYIKGTGIRRAMAFDSSSTSAPKLVVNYTPSGPTEPSPDPTPPPSIIPTFGYHGLKYDPLVKPVYDQAYRDGFMSEDKDGDGLPDSWELAFGLDPTDPNDAASMDKDQDLLTAKEEFLAATSPIDPDSDGDGLPDGYEVIYGLDPTNSADALLDLDGDGYSNLDEYLAGTDPTNNISFPIIVPITYTVEIGWDAPTTREDGSNFPESEVAAYIVHYGTQLDDLSSTARVDDPAARSTQVILNSPGTYYFSVSVLDTNNAESSLSTTQPVTVGQ